LFNYCLFIECSAFTVVSYFLCFEVIERLAEIVLRAGFTLQSAGLRPTRYTFCSYKSLGSTLGTLRSKFYKKNWSFCFRNWIKFVFL